MSNANIERRDIVKMQGFDETFPKIKAVAFDLDGTLCDSVGRIIACTCELFSDLKLPRPDDKAITATIGMRLEEGLRQLLPDDLKHSYLEVTKRYREIFLAHAEFQIDKMFPKVEEVMDALRSRGLKTGFVSGRVTAGVMRTMNCSCLGQYMDALACGEDGPSKPDPTLMHVFSKRLDIPCENILGIGDADLDIGMCRGAGAVAMGVQTGVCSGDWLMSLPQPPHFLIPEIGDLLEYI